jgi:hypothetical protein
MLLCVYCCLLLLVSRFVIGYITAWVNSRCSKCPKYSKTKIYRLATVAVVSSELPLFKSSSSCSGLHIFEVAVVIANYKNFVVNPPLIFCHCSWLRLKKCTVRNFRSTLNMCLLRVPCRFTTSRKQQLLMEPWPLCVYRSRYPGFHSFKAHQGQENLTLLLVW